MRRGPVRTAFAFGIGGGLVAALVTVVPALIADPAHGRLAEYLGLAVGLLAVHLGMRASARERATLASRLAHAALLASALSVIVGLGLYGLYEFLRPELLGARFTAYEQAVAASGASPARVAGELARLEASRAAYLDPRYQALQGASTLFFFAMLLGGYGAWRAHVASRLARARAAQA